jgi:hypothetical protein
MNELLDIAIKAHGGLERWSKVNAVKTNQAGEWLADRRLELVRASWLGSILLLLPSTATFAACFAYWSALCHRQKKLIQNGY